MDALVMRYLFKPDSWGALVEVTREAFGLDSATELASKARPQAGYMALAHAPRWSDRPTAVRVASGGAYP